MRDIQLIPEQLPDRSWVERWRKYLVRLGNGEAKDRPFSGAEMEALNSLCDLAISGIQSRTRQKKPAMKLAAKYLRSLADQLDNPTEEES